MSWLAALMLAQSAPAATPPTAVRVRALARIVAPARVVAGQVEAGSTPQIRDRPGIRLVEFQ